jgi:hypothetical protein
MDRILDVVYHNIQSDTLDYNNEFYW